MKLCRVKNKYKDSPQDNDVYIGRPSIFGNPFVIGKDGSREEVIEKYRQFIQKPENAALRQKAKSELMGKNLVCFCSPLPCHGDVLLEIANDN